MKITGHQNIVLALALLIVAGLFSSYADINSRAQDKPRVPARSSYVNDFAGVLDEQTKQRLETTLENVKRRSGIEFDVALVQTTGTQDIFNFSTQLAGDWNLGSRNAPSKSLLLVISVNEKDVFTQFSKSVQGDLPEGILGEIGQRVRGEISSGRFNEGVGAGVAHFVNALATKFGFSLQDIDQPPATANLNQPIAKPAPTAEVVAPVANPAPTIEEVATPAANPPSTTTDEPIAVTKQPTQIVNDVPALIPPPVRSDDATRATEPPAKTVNAKPNLTTPPAKITRSRIVTPPPAKATTARPQPSTPADDEAKAEEVELTLTLPLAERAAKLKEFLDAYPTSKARPRAVELLISTHAGLGDQKLKEGDSKGGTEHMMLAIFEAPATITDRLFSGVIAQIPSNLYLREQRAEAIEAARMIEAKFGSDAKRLLALTGFYLSLEDGEETARLGAQAVKLAPDLADAHRALGLGLHLSLRLDEAATEYKRALELDPNPKKGTRRSLADLDRASGKSEEALALYRAQLVAEPTDRAARTGVVLSLLDLGLDEGNKELDTVLQSDPRNLALLTGAAYWFVAHKQGDRALELARKAVELEPRYTWAQIALARALSSQKNPLDAERAIRFAGQYGKFPTLDYELANVLASMGLYEEAAEVLQRSFVLKDGQLETRLAGRVLARAASFTELLAPERRAGIFQFTSADNANDPGMLKALLALTVATTQTSDQGKLDEARAIAAAREFAGAADDMRTYRQLYAASRLLKSRVALPTVIELTDAARLSADAALGVPAVTVAVQAEELREMRTRAISQGQVLDVPEASRNLLANILSGRIEDLAGLALFNQDKTIEAVAHFKRAAGILPEGTPLWRNLMWHLGAALDQAGNKPEALNYYIKSFNSGEADPLRRVVIEQLYRKLNGSLDGLEDRIGAKPVPASRSPGPPVDNSFPTETTTRTVPSHSESSPEPTPSPSPSSPAVVTPSSTPPPEVTAPAEPSPSPTPALVAATSSSPEPTAQSRAAEVVGEMIPTVPSKIKVSGIVKDASGNGIANVVVVLISPRGTVIASTTDAEGNYSFIVSPSSQSYRLIPSKDGFSFLPVDKVLAGFTEDQKAVGFVGTQSKP